MDGVGAVKAMPGILSRESALDIVQAACPGLFHFSFPAPLTVLVDADVRRVRLYLKNAGILNLSQFRIDGQLMSTEGCEGYASSHFGSIDPSEASHAFVTGRVPLHTNEDPTPWFEIRFHDRYPAGIVSVHNRPGMWGARSYGLCVDWELENGLVFTFDNAEIATLTHRLNNFQQLVVSLKQALNRREVESGCSQHAVATHQDVSRLVAALRDTLARGINNAAALEELRFAVLRRAAAQFRQIDGPLLENGFAESLMRICEWLIWKGPGGREDVLPIERDVAAFILANEVTRTGKVDSMRAMDFHRFMSFRSDLIAFEENVNRYIPPASEGGRACQFHKHGLYPAKLTSRLQEYLEVMRRTMGYFEDWGYVIMLGYGTLLGAIRDGGFIAWDDDVDLLYVSHARTLQQLQAELTLLKNRFESIGAQVIVKDELFLKIDLDGAGATVDVFPGYSPESGKIVLPIVDMNFRALDMHRMMPAKKIDFYGNPTWVPNDPEYFLESHFGESWSTPNRYFGLYWLEDRL